MKDQAQGKGLMDFVFSLPRTPKLIALILTFSIFLQFVAGVSLEARQVAEANSNFSQAVYELLKEDKRFGVFSPLALTTGLLALAAGARGSTENILKSGLLLADIERNTLENGMADILLMIKEEEHQKARFRSSFRILIPPGIAFLQKYKLLLRNKFGSGSTIENVNTAEAILELEKSESLNRKSSGYDGTENTREDSTGGVLLSSADFIGPWKKKFGYSSTRLRHFFVNENDRVTIEMMNHDDYFYFANLPDLDATGVMLPLEGDRFGLIILLPNTRTGLIPLESAIKRHRLLEIPKKLKRTWVDVWIPKFELNSTVPFVQNGVISKLGLGAILYPSADFGDISCGGDLFFTDVTQRTRVILNEEGIGGMKPSISRVEKLSSRGGGVQFNAEHPFLFFIYDYFTKSIIILGRKLN